MRFSTISLYLVLSITLYSCGQQSDNSEERKEDKTEVTTTYYFIRHSEKDRTDPNNSDPNLTEDGQIRANNWAEELADVDFDAIYSTNLNRTRQTATPLAEKNNLDLKFYDANSLYDEEFKKNTAGKTVMVVGHSNTTPIFANAVLGENKYQEMADDNNGALYIVTVNNGKATSELRQIN